MLILIDLADFHLPVMDEPKHPRLGDYQHAHTKKLGKKRCGGRRLCVRHAGVQFFRAALDGERAGLPLQ
jgi:hypothetical protein